MPNARLSERAPFLAEVDILAAGAPAPRRVWGSDVSESGMFLHTRHHFRAGDKVSLRFDCHDHAVHVKAAEVIWVRSCEPISVDGKLPGVGLKFMALDPPSRAALRKFIAPLVPTSRRRDTLPETPVDELEAPTLATAGLAPLVSQPPREAAAPAPVTIGPRAVNDRATATAATDLLAAWTFRRDDGDVVQSKPRDTQCDITLIAAVPLDLRFDDENPAARARADAAADTNVLDRLLHGDGERNDLPSDQGDEEVFRAAVESAVKQGELALRSLPSAEERRAAPAVRARSRPLHVAVALLCLGTLVGIVLGTAMRKMRPPTPVAAIAAVTPPAPTVIVPPARQVAPVVTSPAATSTPAPMASTRVKKKAPQANAVPAVGERRAIDVRVGDARVVRAFTLESPSRIVVDIEGGQLPKAPLFPGAGIAKVRFGTAAAGMGRIVVELDQSERANGIETWVKAGILVLTFR
jgi:Tfp pilus assembly protein PilZ